MWTYWGGLENHLAKGLRGFESLFLRQKIKHKEIFMRTKLYYENRIALLTAKGAERNRHLIAKAQRKLRKFK